MRSAPAGRSSSIFEATKIDPWFLAQIEDLCARRRSSREEGFGSLELPSGCGR